jgi:hypothetical protein
LPRACRIFARRWGADGDHAEIQAAEPGGSLEVAAVRLTNTRSSRKLSDALELQHGAEFDRFAPIPIDPVAHSRLDAWQKRLRLADWFTGPKATVHGIPVLDRIREIVRISRQGLERQARCNEHGEDETIFLRPIELRLEQGWECPAREVLSLWNREWGGDVRRLIAHCRF